MHYCKLFSLLPARQLPACIIRILNAFYVGNLTHVSWNGVVSDYFRVTNGVKQGGVLSPTLFCVYIDGLLSMPSKTEYGCYIGPHFVGALAYADDLVLLAPTPTAMRRMLAVCDALQ